MKESPHQDPEPTAHPCDAPGLSPRAFLLAVMHDPQLPVRERMKAASALLRIYPRDWDPPSAKIIIGGIPHCSSSASGPRPAMERTENGSQKRESSHKSLNHSGEPNAPVNIETIIEDIRSGNYPQPTLCTICGHHMPYPCSITKTPIN